MKTTTVAPQEKFQYFDGIPLLAHLQVTASVKIRRQIYEWFKHQLCGVKGKKILDHGSTPDIQRLDSNCFIRWLIEDGAIVYATSPEKIDHLETSFPGLQVIPWPAQSSDLPALDGIISSAVIEHVGSRSNQLAYLESLLQFNTNVLVTTPNRFHWVEFHTKVPLLHWLPPQLHRALLSLFGRSFWALEENLNLFSKKDFCRLIDMTQVAYPEFASQYYYPHYLGRCSNLIALLKK